MKFSLFLFMLCFTGLSAQTTATLDGHIDHPKGNKVYLKYYNDYLSFEEIIADSAVISKKGDFKMTFDWSTPGPVTFYHGDEITELYLCPGDELHLSLDTRQFDETLIYKGIGSDRNVYCAEKMLKSAVIDAPVYKLEPEAFTSYVDSIKEVKLQRLAVQESSYGLINQCMTQFLNFERAEIEYEWASTLMNYPLMYRYHHQLTISTPIALPDVSYLKQVKINNPEAIQSTWYTHFLTLYIDQEVNVLAAHVGPLDRMTLKEKYIVDNFSGPVLDFAYANMVYDMLTMEGDTTASFPALRRYKQHLPNGVYIAILDSIVEATRQLEAGKKAPNFMAADASGKSYSLQDFRGKFVYLDIWATWCGPCVGEIPSMEKLIDLYEGEDVVFISVSVDDNQARWKKFVSDKKMRGVQLHTPGGFESTIAKQFAVVGIPRYVLIDKEGIIIDANASRPGYIRDQLNELLD